MKESLSARSVSKVRLVIQKYTGIKKYSDFSNRNIVG